ncbi:MAG: hypothetical protein ACFFAE_01380 [Candidatus Hodarchaeota archaeon]
MRRKSSIPYGETTILSLQNITTDTKFQLIAKVKNINQNKITITDDHENLELNIEGEELSDLKPGDIVVVFGKKSDSGINKEQIIKSNLDWGLYQRTRELESR